MKDIEWSTVIIIMGFIFLLLLYLTKVASIATDQNQHKEVVNNITIVEQTEQYEVIPKDNVVAE